MRVFVNVYNLIWSFIASLDSIDNWLQEKEQTDPSVLPWLRGYATVRDSLPLTFQKGSQLCIEETDTLKLADFLRYQGFTYDPRTYEWVLRRYGQCFCAIEIYALGNGIEGVQVNRVYPTFDADEVDNSEVEAAQVASFSNHASSFYSGEFQ